MRFVAVRFLAVLILTLAVAGPTVAQAPSSAPSLDPSPSPSASPFPYPTVPPASDVPHGPKLVPRGKPDASVTRHGIRVELWQSSPTVAPGEWVRFAVRTTNLGRDSAWQMSGECLTSGTEMTADLRAVTPAGQAWTGNAAAYKERVTKPYATAWIPRWRYLDQLWATATAWAECTVMPGPLELRPGQSRVEHFAWYAGDRLHPDRGDLWIPPYPGTLSVTAEWPFLSRGDRPVIKNLGRVRTVPIRLEVPLTITGDGPSTPSLHELVDIALADPAWRAWVEADPTRQGWDLDFVDAILRVGPDDPDRFLDTFDHPDGILELELQQRLPGEVNATPGSILLDPWTGEVLHVRVPDRVLDAAASASPSPMPIALVTTIAPEVATSAALRAERTHVVISGPVSDWHPRPGFVLEVGDEEWLVRGSIGVRAVVALPIRVVIRDLRDCRVAFSFIAREGGPGAGYLVTIDEAGAFKVERGHGFSEGPYVPSSPVTTCHLPDTSTTSHPSLLPASVGTLPATIRSLLLDLIPWWP
jgi:hypothetical protein